jgi:hypothetical protein
MGDAVTVMFDGKIGPTLALGVMLSHEDTEKVMGLLLTLHRYETALRRIEKECYAEAHQIAAEALASPSGSDPEAK